MKVFLRSIIRAVPGGQSAFKNLYFLFVLIYNKIYWSYKFKIKTINNKVNNKGKVILFGWYGTETIGDMFILLGLLSVFHRENNSIKIDIVSINKVVTRHTIDELVQFLNELNIKKEFAEYIVNNVKVYPESHILSVASNDKVVLGGGPLMDDPILGKWNVWMANAKKRGAFTVVAGCGVGPVCKKSSIRELSKLFKKTDTIIVRNKFNYEMYNIDEERILVCLDPAFLCFRILSSIDSIKDKQLAINSRSVPYEYTGGGVIQDNEVVHNTEKYVAAVLNECSDISSIVGFSTHDKDIINDTVMSDLVIKAVLNKGYDVNYNQHDDCTMLGLVNTLSKSEYVVTTRFHGMIVSLMLGCQVSALDYASGGGKSAKFYAQYKKEAPVSTVYEYNGFNNSDFIRLDEVIGLKQSVDVLERQYANAIFPERKL